MLGPSDKDIVDFIKAKGLKSIYDTLSPPDQKVFASKIKEVQIKKDFGDLRFAELEELSDMATVYKVKNFEDLNSLESKSFMKFISYVLFRNRVIKLYPNEYESLPPDIKTILSVDDTYHDRLKQSVIIKEVKEDGW